MRFAKRRLAETHSQAALGNDRGAAMGGDGKYFLPFYAEMGIIPPHFTLTGARLSGGPPNTIPDNGER